MAEEQDVACHLGVLLHKLGRCSEALDYFNRSIAIYGPHATIAYNISMCHYGLRQMEAALESIHQAMALDPDCEKAGAMQSRIEAVISCKSDGKSPYRKSKNESDCG
jgi:tetratricopeptide (TPR) repeat protein